MSAEFVWQMHAVEGDWKKLEAMLLDGWEPFAAAITTKGGSERIFLRRLYQRKSRTPAPKDGGEK